MIKLLTTFGSVIARFVLVDILFKLFFEVFPEIAQSPGVNNPYWIFVAIYLYAWAVYPLCAECYVTFKNNAKEGKSE